MRNIRSSAGVFGILALATIAFSGCNNPTPVDTSYDSTTLYTEETLCPTIEEICTSIANDIESMCPRTIPPRNWGDENSCRKTLMAQLLDSYKDCLTGNQLSEVRDCVELELRMRTEGDYKGPDPYQS
jgi:hypothetical protein